MRAFSVAPLILALLGLACCAGCGSGGGHTSSKPPVLSVATKPKLGQYLVVNGYTVYMYPPDKQRKVTCTNAGACKQAWPPLFVKSGQHAIAGPGVDSRLIGAVPGDGGRVVTYGHWPLYYYEGDQKPGQVNGQDQSFDWFVISPSGTPIHTGPLTTG